MSTFNQNGLLVGVWTNLADKRVDNITDEIKYIGGLVQEFLTGENLQYFDLALV